MNPDALRIETERLIPHSPQLADVDAYASHMADPEAIRFIGRQQARAAAWRGFPTVAAAWATQGLAMSSVTEKSSGSWIGRLGPWHPVDWLGFEVGCGQAREGAVAAIDWAFDQRGRGEVRHSIAPYHSASQALARRLGATCQGTGKLPAPSEETPIEIGARPREQWRQRRAQP